MTLSGKGRYCGRHWPIGSTASPDSVSYYTDYISMAETLEMGVEYNTAAPFCATASSGKMRFEAATDGSAKMPDRYMEALLPFDLEEAKSFSIESIVGRPAEAPDDAEGRCRDLVTDDATRVMERELAVESVRQKAVAGVCRIASCDTAIEDISYESYLLPMWLAHGTWEGKDVLLAVNGQTGSVACELPCDESKRKTVIALSSLLAASLPLVLLFLSPLLFAASIVLIFGYAGIAAWLISLYDKNNKADLDSTSPRKKDDVGEESLGTIVKSGKLEDVERWRSEDSYGSYNEVLSALAFSPIK